MTFTAWPFENADTTETQYSILMRELGYGVVGGAGSTGLAVTADSSGMTVKVAAGRCLGRGMAGENNALATVTIPTASAATRYDRVVARFDPTTNAGALAVVAGVSGSTTPGALTQSDAGVFEVCLAVVRVTGGTVTIAASDVTDAREWVGTKVREWTTGTRPAPPQRGELGRNSTLSRWEWWDGDSWELVTPLGSGATDAAPGNHAHAGLTSGEAALAIEAGNLVWRTDGVNRLVINASGEIGQANVAGLEARFDGLGASTSAFTGPSVACPTGVMTVIRAHDHGFISGRYLVTAEVLLSSPSSTIVNIELTAGNNIAARRIDVGSALTAQGSFAFATTFDGSTQYSYIRAQPTSVAVTAIGEGVGMTLTRLGDL